MEICCSTRTIRVTWYFQHNTFNLASTSCWCGGQRLIRVFKPSPELIIHWCPVWPARSQQESHLGLTPSTTLHLDETLAITRLGNESAKHIYWLEVGSASHIVVHFLLESATFGPEPSCTILLQCWWMAQSARLHPYLNHSLETGDLSPRWSRSVAPVNPPPHRPFLPGQLFDGVSSQPVIAEILNLKEVTQDSNGFVKKISPSCSCALVSSVWRCVGFQAINFFFQCIY